MEDIVKTLDIKFKLLTVINNSVIKKENILHERLFKDCRENIRSEDHGYRTRGCSMRKTRGHRCLRSRDKYTKDPCIRDDH